MGMGINWFPWIPWEYRGNENVAQKGEWEWA